VLELDLTTEGNQMQNTQNDKFYSGKMKQGKPSRDRKTQRENKRQS